MIFLLVWSVSWCGIYIIVVSFSFDNEMLCKINLVKTKSKIEGVFSTSFD